MSDWDYSEVGGQKRWTITLPDSVYLRIYLNPGDTGDALQGGPYHWQVVVGESVADSRPAWTLPSAKQDAISALIASAERLLEAARNLGQ